MTRREQDRQRIVRLLWLYFVFLLIEGALRKWVLPSWSNPLLLVRDPIAAAILFFANRDGFLPVGGSLRGLQLLAFAFIGLAALQLAIGVPLLVLLFGLRTYFLHPPLIFIMAAVLSARDVRRFVIAVTVCALPIALLMAQQFRSGPGAWINRGAGEGGMQILTSLGRIRPAGPFSFISGPIQYFAMAFACLIALHFSRAHLTKFLLLGGWGSVLLAAAVSGSRSLVAGLVPVGLALVAGFFIRPSLVGGAFRMAATGAAVAMVVWTFGVVREGVDVFNMRMEESGGTAEMMSRSGSSYDLAASAWTSAPLLGVGLGVGTNAVSALLGQSPFQVGETEWMRVIYEAGPVLGLAYILWRLWLIVELARWSVRAAAIGNLLPITLLGAGASAIAVGQWGQPTSLGFAVWVAGLSLAAARVSITHAARVQRDKALYRRPARVPVAAV